MNHRKTLYGYQIRDGEIAVVEEEAILVRRVFSLYIGGLSYQKISDLLNREEIPYSQEAPAWNKHKVKRLLENPRYTGQDGYPAIIDKVGFEETQSHIHEKTAGYAPKTERPVLRLKRYLRCSKCGAPLRRVAGKNHRADTLYLKCSECGAMVTIPDEMLLEDVTHQVTEHDAPSQEPYQPSEEVIRLTNAINRGLEHPDHPEELVSLILQVPRPAMTAAPQLFHLNEKTTRWMWIGTASGRWFLILPSRQKIWWLSPSDKPPGKEKTWNRHWNVVYVLSRRQRRSPIQEPHNMANSE